MKDSDFIIAQYARLCYLDGSEEGLNTMLGCAFTIRNRIRAGWYNGQWHDVLSHHKEWSATLEPYPDIIPDPRSYNFMSFLQQIDGIFNGSTEDFITVKRDGEWKYILTTAPPPALYYGRLDKITNPYFLENISRQPDKHPIIAQCGLLSFFA